MSDAARTVGTVGGARPKASACNNDVLPDAGGPHSSTTGVAPAALPALPASPPPPPEAGAALAAGGAARGPREKKATVKKRTRSVASAATIVERGAATIVERGTILTRPRQGVWCASCAAPPSDLERGTW